MGRIRVTENELLEAVRASGTQPKPTGEGWLSTNDIAERLRVSTSTARQRLKRLLAAGQVERVVCPGLTCGVMAYWRFKP
jgi:DNA-binding Lrp family transcriptional regulator